MKANPRNLYGYTDKAACDAVIKLSLCAGKESEKYACCAATFLALARLGQLLFDFIGEKT